MMVKGTNRRVVVVKFPNTQIFEEAIFIIKEDFARQGSSAEQVMAEAKKAARDYIKSAAFARKRPIDRLHGPLLAVVGAAAAGIAWLTMHFVGV